MNTKVELEKVKARVVDLFDALPWQHPLKKTTKETDREYILSFDVSGVPRDSLKIEMNQNELTILGEKNSSEMGKSDHFKTKVRVPADAAVELIYANYENGTLKVVIPKNTQMKTKSISISDGASQSSDLSGGSYGI